MINRFEHLKNLIKKIGIAFLLFTLCRIAFYLVNSNYFPNVSFDLFIYGIRFDAVAISFLMAPLIILQLIPAPFRNFNWYKKMLNVFFYVGLIVGLIPNMIDVGYFDYSLKRSTADLYGMITTGDDFITLLPHYIIDFWYAYVILAILIYITVFLHKRFCKLNTKFLPYTVKDYLTHSIIFIVFCGITLIGMRGGTQYKPLSIINAGQYSSAQNIPIVLNTPFAIMKTLSADKIELKTYFTKEELDNIYTPEKYINGTGNLKGKNVVLMILESFSKEYIGYLNEGKGYTPFLDSLMQQSMVYTNAYANGSKSIESLPCILSGLPQLMPSSYIISNYSSNQLDALPKILKKYHYNTSFYHGGANGTMGFNGFVGITGIDDYYGLNEYPKATKEKDYDGLWGIFDEPYLQYFIKELDQKPEPFFSTVFTLSSHHPYTIPNGYKNTFPKGVLDIHESIGYADYSLRQFFEVAKTKKWFKNSIFVFTADHASISESPYYETKLNRFAIPIFIFDPSGNLKGNNDDYFQQIDITPTLLNLLGIQDSIITFGNHSNYSSDNYVINYVNNSYQMAFNDYFLIFNGEETTDFYNIKNDSLLSVNLMGNLNEKEEQARLSAEKKLKAIIQQYNNRIINNELSNE